MNELNYIAIDFETANKLSCSACSIGLIRFENGVETDSVCHLIKPAVMYFVPEWTRDIHHISYEDVADQPCFPEVWQNLVQPFLDKTPDFPLVAHNASFDMGVIKGCCDRFNMELPKIRYFDSLRISRRTWPELKSHALTFLGSTFGIDYLAHDALEDSRTCGLIIKLACEKWNVASVDELLCACNSNLQELS